MSRWKCTRPVIDLEQDMIRQIADNSLGAMNVLFQIARDYPRRQAMNLLLILDDMNIRGVQVWEGFKACHEEPAGREDTDEERLAHMDRFVQRIEARDPELVETINRNYPPAKKGEKAVVRGAAIAKYY